MNISIAKVICIFMFARVLSGLENNKCMQHRFVDMSVTILWTQCRKNKLTTKYYDDFVRNKTIISCGNLFHSKSYNIKYKMFNEKYIDIKKHFYATFLFVSVK